MIEFLSFLLYLEFDSIAATRGGLEDGMSSRRLLSELLLQLTEQKQIQAQESKVLVLKSSKDKEKHRDREPHKPCKRPLEAEYLSNGTVYTKEIICFIILIKINIHSSAGSAF